MPIFFFHTAEDGRALPDLDGTEFPNLICARREALSALTELSKDSFAGEGHRELSITVEDETGKQVYSASLTLNERFGGLWAGS